MYVNFKNEKNVFRLSCNTTFLLLIIFANSLVDPDQDLDDGIPERICKNDFGKKNR